MYKHINFSLLFTNVIFHANVSSKQEKYEILSF